MRFPILSLRQKLVLITMVTTGVALLLACTAFVTYDLKLLKQSSLNTLQTQASILGANSTAAVRFNDAEDAASTLESLRGEAHIEAACIYTLDGQRLASYFRDEPVELPSAKALAAGMLRIQDGRMECAGPIQLDGEVIGTVYLQSNLDEFYARGRAYVMIFIIVLVGSLVVALAMASRLQKAVSGPILHLTDTARRISTEKDYSLRAAKETRDELGFLIDCFNEMLSQIQQRDAALESHRNSLEYQVAERTRQLSDVNTQLTGALDRAEAGSRAKTAFLANMSHEMRTPMTAILGYADMLLDPQRTPSDRYDYLQIIRRNARHLMELINDVLDISKIEAEKMSVEKITFELPQIISDVVSMVRPRALDKELDFQLQFTGLIPRYVCSDPLRLKQVLLNILGNALKFTHRGGIALAVGCEVRPGGCTLRFEISDSGIGLEAEQLNQLFQPFTQADESTTRKYGGTGLGLVISKKLVDLLGGDISVVSRPGRGSTFTVRIDGGLLDGVEMLSDLTESLLPRQHAVDPSDFTFLRGRILLAEDGPDNQLLISTLLREAGADVVVAENGRVAVELATAQQFDLIFMDMQMPELDGYGATSQLRNLGHKLPIVALTAHAMAHDRAKCIAAGCTDYCTKPIERQRLLKVAARYLRQSRQSGGASEASAEETRAETPQVASHWIKPSRVTSLDVRPNSTVDNAVEEFVSRLPKRVAQLTDLFEAEKLDELQRIVHQLKGAGGGFGFTHISQSAARMEQSIKNNAELADIRGRLDELIAVIRTIEGYPATEEKARKVS